MPETRLFIDDRFAVVDTVLAADVATTGTFTVGYPTGFVQKDFTNSLSPSTGGYAQVNGNNRWTQADSKVSFSFDASVVTVTNSSGETWSAGQSVRLYFPLVDGNTNVEILSFPFDLADIANGDIVTEWQPGIDGTIEAFDFVTTKAVTTGSKAATINLEIDTTNVTGGVISLTSAAATPIGKVINGTAITANNRLYRKSVLSIEAASVTAFVEGKGVFMIRVRKTPNA